MDPSSAMPQGPRQALPAPGHGNAPPANGWSGYAAPAPPQGGYIPPGMMPGMAPGFSAGSQGPYPSPGGLPGGMQQGAALPPSAPGAMNNLPVPYAGGGNLPAAPMSPGANLPGAWTGGLPYGPAWLHHDEHHGMPLTGILWRHRWLEVSVLILTVLLVAFQTVRQTPLYEARSTLRIEQRGATILAAGEDPQAQSDRLRFYDTQYKLLRGRSLATKTAESMNLLPQFETSLAKPSEPSLFQKAINGARSALGIPPSVNATESMPLKDRARQSAGDWVLEHLNVRPEPNSELVHLHVTAADPNLAAKLANELARQYIRATLEDRAKTFQTAGEYLDRETSASLARLGALEAERREAAGGSDELALEKRRELAEQRLGDLGRSLADGERTVLEKKSLMDQTNADPASSPLAREHQIVVSLTNQYQDEQSKFNLMTNEYGPKYPPLQQAWQNLAATRRRLDAALEDVKRAATTSYNLELENYETLKKTYEEQRQQVVGLEDILLSYRIKNQQVESERSSYQRLLDRSKEIELARGMAFNTVRLAEEAVAPSVPAHPRVGRNLALGVLAGLVLAVVAGLGAHQMDRTLKSAEELERLLGLASLTTVRNLKYSGLRLPDGRRAPPALVSHAAPASAEAESFRYLRTALLYAGSGGMPQVLMLTSARPSEGKTTVTINTVTVLAQGARVLLIDGDLRRPSCHSVLGVPGHPGLADLLQRGDLNNAALDAIIHPSPIPNVDFLPAGKWSGTIPDLLNSPRLPEVLALLRGRYATIVVDSAPLAGVSDGLVLARHVDGVVLVVEAGSTPRDLARRVLTQLRGMQARVLGAVVNAHKLGRLDWSSGAYGYGYGYGYAYGYGGYGPRPDRNAGPGAPPQTPRPPVTS